MKVDIVKNQKLNEIAIVRLSGRLDAQNTEGLEDELLDLFKKGYNFLIIDLKEIIFLGSSGVRIFLELNNQLNKANGRLKILNIPEMGIKILKAMEILNRFDIYKTEAEALKSF